MPDLLRCAHCGSRLRLHAAILPHVTCPDGRRLHPACVGPFRRAEDLRLLAEMEGDARREVVSDWTRETTR